MLRVDAATSLYRSYNKAYFDNVLPNDTEIRVVKNLRSDGANPAPAHGATSKLEDGRFLLELDSALNSHMLYLTMGHELIHIKIWPSSHRTKAWRSEVARLGSIGFLSEVL